MAPDDPKDPTDQRNGDSVLLTGVTSLIALLTAVAAANGAVTRMFRNHPFLTIVAFLFVILAFGFGLLLQAKGRLWWTLGSIALTIGFAFGVSAQVLTASLSNRPSISATATRAGKLMHVETKVVTDLAKARDQLLVAIYGVPADGSETRRLYYAKTGPNNDGDFEQTPNFDVPADAFAELRIYAVFYGEGDNAAVVNCDGEVVDEHDQPIEDPATKAPFKTTGLVGCLTLRTESSSTS